MNLYGRKLVSVHMPTRGRREKCLGSAIAAREKVLDPDRVEFIFKLDYDDEDWFADRHYSLLEEADPCASKTVILSENKGYSQVHEYYNLCARISEGDWLFHFSDDAVMKTPNWDQVIADCGIDGSKQIAVLWPNNDGEKYCFPIVSRRWYQFTGRLSGHISLDGWVKQIGDALKVSHDIDIQIGHDKHEVSGIARDTTRINRDLFLDRLMREDPEWPIGARKHQIEIEKDIAKLKAAMEAGCG